MSYAFLRAVKYALQDFWRNFWLSVVTITVLVLALLSVNVLISLDAISGQVVQSVKDKVDISVFFKRETPIAVINNFQEKVKKMPAVKEVVFVAKEQALEAFKVKHGDDPAIMSALKELEKNPLTDALIIKAANTGDYKSILSFVNREDNQEFIKYQNYTDHEKIISRIGAVSRKVEKFSFILTAIFSAIAVLIVFNAIRVAIYTHREEIAVMRLVGASNSFIRAPFLLTGVIYAGVALLITAGLLYALFAALGPYLNGFLETYDFNLAQYYNQHFWQIFLAEFGAAVLLNVISSGIAIGKYLKI